MGMHASADVAFGFNLYDPEDWESEAPAWITEADYLWDAIENKLNAINDNRPDGTPAISLLTHGHYEFRQYAVVIKESAAGNYEPGDITTFTPAAENERDSWRAYLFGVAKTLGVDPDGIEPSYFIVSSYG